MSPELSGAEKAYALATKNDRRLQVLENHAQTEHSLVSALKSRLEELELRTDIETRQKLAENNKRRVELLEDEIRILRTAVSTNRRVPR